MDWSDADPPVQEEVETNNKTPQEIEIIVGSKLECLCRISEDAIRDHAHLERRAYNSGIRFKCKREGCPFVCYLRLMSFGNDKLRDDSHESDDPDDSHEMIPAIDYADMWRVTVLGRHDHIRDPDDRDLVIGIPLREHVEVITARHAADNRGGKALAEAVSATLGVVVPAHVTSRIARKLTCSEQAESWYKMMPLLRCLEEAGFHTAYSTVLTDGQQALEYCYVETCYAAHFLESDAFVGVLFLDGAHLSDIAKHTMLSVCTVTADRIVLPLAMAVVDGENNKSYKFFMESMRDGAFKSCKRATVFADQHAAIKHALDTVFPQPDTEEAPEEEEEEDANTHYDYILMPCIWHLTAHMKGKEQFKQLIWTDHRQLYQKRLENYKETHESEWERFNEHIERMSYCEPNSESDRCFGYIADSPVECVNKILKGARSREPCHLIEEFLETSLDRRQAQLDKLTGQGAFCGMAKAREEKRKGLAKTLAVTRRSERSCYVTEIWSENCAGKYNVRTTRDSVLSCSCREFERIGVACRHMHAVASKYPGLRLPDPADCYRSVKIREGLGVDAEGEAKVFYLPNLGELEQEEQPMHAPRRQPGRPRTKRIRSAREEYHGARQSRACGFCGESGHHTKRTCPFKAEIATAQQAMDGCIASHRAAAVARPKPRRPKSRQPTSMAPSMQSRSRSRPPAPMATRRRSATPSRFNR